MSEEEKKVSPFVYIGALWNPKEGSKAVLTGKLGSATVFIFKNEKKEKENQPDFNICVANTNKKKEEVKLEETKLPF